MPAHEFEAAYPNCYIQRDIKGCFSTGRPRWMLQAVDAEGVCQARRFAMELDNKFRPGHKRLFVSRTELGPAQGTGAVFTPRAPQRASALEDVYAA